VFLVLGNYPIGRALTAVIASRDILSAAANIVNIGELQVPGPCARRVRARAAITGGNVFTRPRGLAPTLAACALAAIKTRQNDPKSNKNSQNSSSRLQKISQSGWGVGDVLIRNAAQERSGARERAVLMSWLHIIIVIGIWWVV
jgi:hypothetical protein